MKGLPLICFVAQLLLHTSFASSVFFHEPSFAVLTSGKEHSDFGFFMGYRTNERQLVVGSPHADQVGKVYSCPIHKNPVSQNCSDLNIDVKKLAPDYDKADSDQNFCLGATISVASKYFVTCAPLWTSSVTKTDNSTVSGSYGTCFVYNDVPERFNGSFEQSNGRYDERTYVSVYGGIGWSSLMDEENEMLLIAKPFEFGDIQYVNSKALDTNAKSGFKSMYAESTQFRGNLIINSNIGKTNVGYAMAAGRFFSDHNESIFYAFSINDESDVWQVNFLKKDTDGTMKLVLKADKHAFTVSSEDDAGDMFGAAMASADLDADGVTDLLVGAPAHSMPGQCECGAVYIFRGMEMSIYQNSVLKIVSGEKRARFGSAMATNDLDGDYLPEIFISAPYEDSGDGAVYIISGYQLRKSSMSYTLDLHLKDLMKLPGMQRIQSNAYRTFGYSLNVVPDINGDGCDELAVGSPQSSSVILFRCLPTIKAIVEAKYPKKVKTSDSSFTVNVCVNITYRNLKPTISTRLQVESRVIGKGATLEKDSFDVDLNRKPSSYCNDVVVKLRRGETGTYSFTATLSYKNDTQFEKEVFDDTWVRLSVDSELVANAQITRACPTDNCRPDLHIDDILWGGSKEPKEFEVNEKTEKNVTLVIINNGSITYDACVRLTVKGGKERIRCEPIIGKQGQYNCPIPAMDKKSKPHNINFVVGIEKAGNVDNRLQITADLYNNCATSAVESKNIDVKYIFGMRNVFIKKSSHNVTVTDTQLKNQTNPTLIDTHEYNIVNKGGLEWEDVSAIINVPSRPYIRSTQLLINDMENSTCVQKDPSTKANVSSDVLSFICSKMRLYDIPILIKVKNEISLANITVEKELNIFSNMEVRMVSSNDAVQFPNSSQTTTINYVKESSFSNNINAMIAIGVVAAVLIVLVVAFILYKIGFFKRKEKNRLESFKASVKSRNRVGHEPTNAGGEELTADSKEDSMDDFDIEVVDECAFEPIPTTTDDDAALIDDDKDETTTSKSPVKERTSN
ncbi:FG-GAP repeat domain-containing protein [Phthorimaea operculella]|nr:FG-GAP repeat domain-containing protein [Phthorimaea operculella]